MQACHLPGGFLFAEYPMPKINREQFLDLLYATHNIGGNAVPETKADERFCNLALRTVDTLFNLIEDHNNPRLRGAIELIVRLLSEVNCAKNESAYAKRETQRGLDGERHQFDNATIKLPCHKVK